MLESLLQTLYRELELGILPEKTEGEAYPLTVSPNLQVDIKALDPGCSFYTPLAPLQNTQQEELLTYLMRANFLGQGTGDGVIALDPDEKFLTLSYVLPYDIDYREFKRALEDFVNYVDFWKEELAEFKRKSEG